MCRHTNLFWLRIKIEISKCNACASSDLLIDVVNLVSELSRVNNHKDLDFISWESFVDSECRADCEATSFAAAVSCLGDEV